MRTVQTLVVFLLLGVFRLFAQDIDSLAGKKTVFLGDSITQDGRYVTYVNYFLEKQYPLKDFAIYGLGLSSETLAGLTEKGHPFPRPSLFERLGRLFERIKPEVIIACYGINDGVNQPLDPDRFAAFKRGVTQLVDQCKAAGVKDIFLVTPPIYDLPPGSAGFNYDTVMTEYAAWEMTLKISGVHFIDLHTAMHKAREARTEPFSRDKVHPGDEGHLLMAKTILAGLGVSVPEQTPATIGADPLFKLVGQKRALLSSRWMNHIGYTRGKTVAPQALGNTEAEVAQIQQKIDAQWRHR